jgi:chondroitin 4-sulfotransferase 11
MFDEGKKYIFTHPPKCAGASIAIGIGLWKHQGGEMFKRYKNLLHRSLTENIIEIEKLNLNYEDFFKFSLVRNPWDRFVSRYFFELTHNLDFYKKNNLDTFDEFVKSQYDKFKSKGDRGFLKIEPFYYHNGKYCMDFIVKQENFENDFLHVCGKIDIKDPEITRYDQGTKRISRDYKNMYNLETKKMIEDMGSDSIEMFEYSF